MLVIAIIALVLSLVAIAVGTILIFRISALFGEFEKGINNDIAGLKQAVKDLEKESEQVVFEGLPGVSYDVEKKTLWVNGNMFATGAVSAFEKKPLED